MRTRRHPHQCDVVTSVCFWGSMCCVCVDLCVYACPCGFVTWCTNQQEWDDLTPTCRPRQWAPSGTGWPNTWRPPRRRRTAKDHLQSPTEKGPGTGQPGKVHPDLPPDAGYSRGHQLSRTQAPPAQRPTSPIPGPLPSREARAPTNPQ